MGGLSQTNWIQADDNSFLLVSHSTIQWNLHNVVLFSDIPSGKTFTSGIYVEKIFHFKIFISGHWSG